MKGEDRQAVLDACDTLITDKGASNAEHAVGYIGRGFWLYSPLDYASAIKLDSRYLAVFELRCFAGKPWIEYRREEACTAAIWSGMEPRDRLSLLYAWRSQHYRGQDRKDSTYRSLVDLAEAIRLNPDQPAYHVLQAFVFSEKDEYDNAIKALNGALKVNSENLRLLAKRANYCHLAKLYDCAIADASTVLARFGKQAPTQSCEPQKYPAKASVTPGLDLDVSDIGKQMQSEMISFSCDSGLGEEFLRGVLAIRATSYAHKGQCKEAVADLDQVIMLEDDWKDRRKLIVTRIKCNTTTGQLDSALSDLKIVVDDHKWRSSELLRIRSRIFWEQGRYFASIADSVEAGWREGVLKPQ